jgi:NAD(P)-dependent dehydrogenase (short-subunit alcohol dehydrogenase family)
MSIHTVVTGANRGIGLELVRQLAARGDRVEATTRDPDRAPALAALAAEAGGRIKVHRLEVTDPAAAAQLARALGGAAIDVLYNVAGIYGDEDQSIERLTTDLALPEVRQVYEVNAIGPLRLTLALLPHVRRGATKKLVHVTSGMASIADNTSGGYYAYRMSKAALNMMSRSLAIDLRAEGIASYVINPGWVQTDMGGPSATTPVADSVRGILATTDAATLADSGEFLNWKGDRYPW